jgi:hypothetical protein
VARDVGLSRESLYKALSVVELVVWQVPSPVSGSAHAFKYRFTTPARLLEDFWNDVDRWRS